MSPIILLLEGVDYRSTSEESLLHKIIILHKLREWRVRFFIKPKVT